MMYSEFSAAVLESMEKKKLSTARLMGPPPMPRKALSRPSVKPISTQAGAFCTSIVRTLPFFSV